MSSLPTRAPRAEGLRPPPTHAPRVMRGTEDLRQLQRLMVHALVRPLAAGDRSPPQWGDGRSTAEVAEEFIKGNDRLSALERLQIYHRVYWYRLIGSARDDSPGLRALLGEKKFDRLITAYLARHPSRSFTLRNLLSRLPAFIARHPSLTAPRTEAALEVARFEWAQTLAFDGPSRPLLTPAAIRRTPPEQLTVGLQPYITLLESPYAVDEYALAVKRRDALRAEASHTSETAPIAAAARKTAVRLKRAPSFLAVHRFENQLYYKKLAPQEYAVLRALQRGASVARAASRAKGADPADVQAWFANWMRLGWLCRNKRPAGRSGQV